MHQRNRFWLGSATLALLAGALLAVPVAASAQRARDDDRTDTRAERRDDRDREQHHARTDRDEHRTSARTERRDDRDRDRRHARADRDDDRNGTRGERHDARHPVADRHADRNHHRSDAAPRSQPRVYAHNSVRYVNGVKHVQHGYYCKPCGRRFGASPAFREHLHRAHRIPFWRIPFVTVHRALGWIFYG